MQPMTVLSLGATLPFSPNAEPGMIYGKASAPAATADDRLKKPRRLRSAPDPFDLRDLFKGIFCSSRSFLALSDMAAGQQL
jgi:hypothetical protein